MHQVCRSLDYADRYIIWCTWYTCNHFCDTSARWLYNLNLNRWFERIASSWWTSIRPHQTLRIGFPWERSNKHMNKTWRLCLCLLCWNICSFQSESKGFKGVRVRFSDHLTVAPRIQSFVIFKTQKAMIGWERSPTGQHRWRVTDVWHTCGSRKFKTLARRFFQGALYVGALKRKRVKMWYC